LALTCTGEYDTIAIGVYTVRRTSGLRFLANDFGGSGKILRRTKRARVRSAHFTNRDTPNCERLNELGILLWLGYNTVTEGTLNDIIAGFVAESAPGNFTPSRSQNRT